MKTLCAVLLLLILLPNAHSMTCPHEVVEKGVLLSLFSAQEQTQFETIPAHYGLMNDVEIAAAQHAFENATAHWRKGVPRLAYTSNVFALAFLAGKLVAVQMRDGYGYEGKQDYSCGAGKVLSSRLETTKQGKLQIRLTLVSAYRLNSLAVDADDIRIFEESPYVEPAIPELSEEELLLARLVAEVKPVRGTENRRYDMLAAVNANLREKLQGKLLRTTEMRDPRWTREHLTPGRLLATVTVEVVGDQLTIAPVFGRVLGVRFGNENGNMFDMEYQANYSFVLKTAKGFELVPVAASVIATAPPFLR